MKISTFCLSMYLSSDRKLHAACDIISHTATCFHTHHTLPCVWLHAVFRQEIIIMRLGEKRESIVCMRRASHSPAIFRFSPQNSAGNTFLVLPGVCVCDTLYECVNVWLDRRGYEGLWFSHVCLVVRITIKWREKREINCRFSGARVKDTDSLSEREGLSTHQSAVCHHRRVTNRQQEATRNKALVMPNDFEWSSLLSFHFSFSLSSWLFSIARQGIPVDEKETTNYFTWSQEDGGIFLFSVLCSVEFFVVWRCVWRSIPAVSFNIFPMSDEDSLLFSFQLHSVWWSSAAEISRWTSVCEWIFHSLLLSLRWRRFLVEEEEGSNTHNVNIRRITAPAPFISSLLLQHESVMHQGDWGEDGETCCWDECHSLSSPFAWKSVREVSERNEEQKKKHGPWGTVSLDLSPHSLNPDSWWWGEDSPLASSRLDVIDFQCITAIPSSFLEKRWWYGMWADTQ